MDDEREQVVLLHGFTSTSRIWDQVAADLRRDHDVSAVPLWGHRGGSPRSVGDPLTIEAFANDVERSLDLQGVGRAHIIGNSLGGWLALELATRARAKSVVALSPAGFWNGRDDPQVARARKIFGSAHTQATLSRPFLGLIFALPALRRFGFRGVARHGDRLTREAAREIVEGSLDCPSHRDLFDGPLADGAGRFEGLGCPVAVRIGEYDRYIPPDYSASRIAERVPEAEVSVMPGVGHIPMIDDPKLVAEEVRGWVARASTGAD